MRGHAGAAVLAALLLSVRPTAQTPVVIDHVLRHVNSGVVTALDVRQARLLHLVDVAAAVTSAPATPAPVTDDEIADVLVDRRLELADLARFSLPEPPPADVAARRRRWEATLDPGVEVTPLLARAGMTDAALTGWLRDQVVLDGYKTQHFSGAQPTHDEVVAFYREHVADYTTGGVASPVDNPRVESDIKARLAAATRAAGIRAWVTSLRSRADIW